jgi:uncharacterized protein
VAASLLMAALLASADARALEVPALRAHVNDNANLLAAGASQQLESRLATFEAQTGHQFALLTVQSLEGLPVEQYALKVAETWKLGRAKPDDGLLMLIAAQEHKARIEVGYGLEGQIPDAIAARVIREVMAPAFQRGDYAGGIEAGFDTLIRVAGGDTRALPVHGQPGGTMGPSGFLVFGGFLFIVLMLLFVGRFGSSRRYYGGFGGWGGGGFGGGGFGGGGFGGGGGGGGFSGGGGGFGGGGASGSW